MASSTGEAAPSSPFVANAAPPPVTTEAKMGARLLAAACSGSFQDLESLLNWQAAASSNRAIGSPAAHPPSASGDVEAFLRESLPYAVTAGGDTILHVVAASHGNGEDFINKARLIYSKAQNLLFMQNNRGDTPLHCAARMWNFEMVSLFIHLARRESVNANRVKALLRTENKSNETALHEAVKSVYFGQNDIVKLLMNEDSQLASFPKDGMSPLYLAILLQKKVMAKTLYDLSGGVISYCGPDGQNALHAAVLQGQDLTKMLLEWDNDLTLQGDKYGCTPLHFAIVAVRWERKKYRQPICSQLLNANPDTLYQPDHNGSFPTHVAASVGATWAITGFLKKSPNCAGLRDARGRTFLHVAVDEMKIWTAYSACNNPSLTWILNMQDNDGNTALHLAVRNGSLIMFCCLFGNRKVHLNLRNEKGQTPLDIARHNIPKGLYYMQNSEVKILLALKIVRAKGGIFCEDYSVENNIEQTSQEKKHRLDQVKEGTQALCIGSILIATVTFGATFAMPGGYRDGDHTNGGTPTLAGTYAFDAFTLANSLAFTFSAMAVIALMSSGSPMFNPRSRQVHISIAFAFMLVSVTSLVAAFALGTYTMLAPVAHKTAVVICAISSLILLYQTLEMAIKVGVLVPALCRRTGICHRIVWVFPLAAFAILGIILLQLWPIVIIFGLSTLCHNGGKVEPVAEPPTTLA